MIGTGLLRDILFSSSYLIQIEKSLNNFTGSFWVIFTLNVLGFPKTWLEIQQNHTVFLSFLSWYRYRPVTVWSSTFLIFPQRDISFVTYRYLPLLTVTHRSFNVTHRYSNEIIRVIKLKKKFVVCLVKLLKVNYISQLKCFLLKF